MVGKIITMIRNDLTTILGEEPRFLAIQTRQRLNLTQKEMGERFHMSYSNYSDIETGQIECCSTLTAILLLGMQSDPNPFINDVSIKFQRWYQREMQPV